MARTTLLLDANLLLLLLIGTMDGNEIERFKRTRQFKVTEFEALVNLVTRAGGIITTPHLLTEVSNLANQLREDQKIDFARIFKSAIEVFEERYTSASTLCEDPLFRFGLADTAIKPSSKDTVVLTEDGRFAGQLADLGIIAMNLRTATNLLSLRG